MDELELAHPHWKIQQKLSGDLRGTWDPGRIIQVFSNLLANAGHHGERGAPISIELDGSAPGKVRVVIHNQGTIPEPVLPRRFEPFCGVRSASEQSRGLGLGLFIVRELVRAHGGSVDVASSEAQGTTFSIQLPRHAPRRNRA